MNRRRGLTLVEVMIALGVFSIVTMGAFMFAQQQIRARKQTEFTLDAEQNARVSLDSIRHDLQLSGLGIGYSVAGTFQGLQMGAMFVGLFNSRNFPLGASNTDDLLIRGATGPVRSVASYDPPNPGNFQVCAGMFSGGVPNPEIAVLVSESYTDAMAIEITGVVTGQACGDDLCINTNSCDQVNYILRGDLYQTDPNANQANYRGGSLFRGFFSSLYFVDAPSVALFRVDMTRDAAGNLLAAGVPSPCTVARGACATPANLLGEGIETLQYRIFELPSTGGAVAEVTDDPAYLAAGGVNQPNRLRIDLELIARSRSQENESPPSSMCSRLQAGLCFPAAGTDRFRRRTLTTSVELRNSGHMKFSSAGL